MKSLMAINLVRERERLKLWIWQTYNNFVARSMDNVPQSLVAFDAAEIVHTVFVEPTHRYQWITNAEDFTFRRRWRYSSRMNKCVQVHWSLIRLAMELLGLGYKKCWQSANSDFHVGPIARHTKCNLPMAIPIPIQLGTILIATLARSTQRKGLTIPINVDAVLSEVLLGTKQRVTAREKKYERSFNQMKDMRVVVSRHNHLFSNIFTLAFFFSRTSGSPDSGREKKSLNLV